jgi:hypothetical protein
MTSQLPRELTMRAHWPPARGAGPDARSGQLGLVTGARGGRAASRSPRSVPKSSAVEQCVPARPVSNQALGV